jgi:hypothetical protein
MAKVQNILGVCMQLDQKKTTFFWHIASSLQTFIASYLLIGVLIVNVS